MKPVRKMDWEKIPELSTGPIPDPDDDYILWSAIKAKRALVAGYEPDDVTVMVEDAITDLLADIRHLCDLLDLSFAERDRIAYNHYIEELHEHEGDRGGSRHIQRAYR